MAVGKSCAIFMDVYDQVIKVYVVASMSYCRIVPPVYFAVYVSYCNAVIYTVTHANMLSVY